MTDEGRAHLASRGSVRQSEPRFTLPETKLRPSIPESRHAVNECTLNSQVPADGRRRHIALFGGEDFLTLRDEVIGRARRQGLNREPRISGPLCWQDAPIAHKQVRYIMGAPELVNNRSGRIIAHSCRAN